MTIKDDSNKLLWWVMGIISVILTSSIGIIFTGLQSDIMMLETNCIAQREHDKDISALEEKVSDLKVELANIRKTMNILYKNYPL